MATFTLVPIPRLGITPEGGMLLNTYFAGGSTPAPTYQDSNGAITNTNPIQADGNGLFPAIYLPLGTSYKFVCTHGVTNSLPPNPTSNLGVIIWTQDGVASVPSSSPALDVSGTAGEALLANACVYQSDGSGGKQSGLWYNADNANAYSSTNSLVGFANEAASTGMTLLVRIGGDMSGFTSLAVGYQYVGTGGAITSTAPATNVRFVGQAPTTTSLVVAANPPKYGPGSPSTLTNHGVVLGQGTSPVIATAVMTTGQLLVGVTGADPVPTAAATAGASMVLLKANSGTDTGAGATNVDTVAITGLTAKDMLLVKIEAISAVQATANIQLYNNTDSVVVTTAVTSLAGGLTLMLTNDIAQSQASATTIWARNEGKDTAPTVYGSLNVASFATAWTGAWTLALRHGGVTGGGTLQWRWSVYKLSGQ